VNIVNNIPLTRNPQVAFEKAVTKLNSKKLTDLWTTSCLLSCIDYFSKWDRRENLFMPMVHVQSVAMLHRAILESKAQHYKSKIFNSKDFPHVYNSLVNATDDASLLSGEADPGTRLRRFLGTLANFQIRFQERGLRRRLGRAYGMLHDIPLTYKDVLSQRHGANFLDLVMVFPEKFGFSVKNFLLIGFCVLTLVHERFYKPYSEIQSKIEAYLVRIGRKYLSNRERSQLLTRLIDDSKSWQDALIFKPQNLVIPGNSIFNIGNVKAYLRLVAKTTQQLRDLLYGVKAYSEGPLAERISPLERYPIVKLEDDTYIVPNLSYFDMSLTELPHFMLQDTYKDNRYNELRGYIQELYLQKMIEVCLPHLNIIPEITYRKAREEVNGPDLTLIESKKLIVLESKAKRMRVASRVAPASEAFVEDIKGAFSAFEKIPSKIEDLYTGLPEYRSYKNILDMTRDSKPVATVVMGEGIYFMAEFLQDYLRDNPEHFLNRYTCPFCLLELDTFEDAVTIAATGNYSLHDLLRDYWEDSKITTVRDHPAEGFRGRKARDINPFIKKYVDMLFAELKPS
jgi:hypothetical protein